MKRRIAKIPLLFPFLFSGCFMNPLFKDSTTQLISAEEKSSSPLLLGLAFLSGGNLFPAASGEGEYLVQGKMTDSAGNPCTGATLDLREDTGATKRVSVERPAERAVTGAVKTGDAGDFEVVIKNSKYRITVTKQDGSRAGVVRLEINQQSHKGVSTTESGDVVANILKTIDLTSTSTSTDTSTTTSTSTDTSSSTTTDTSTGTSSSTSTDTSTAVVAPTSIVYGSTNISATIGDVYSLAAPTVDGTSPYTFTVTSGSLPGGLSLDSSTGAISGTISEAGPFTLDVTASNTAGSASATLVFDVSPLPPGTPDLQSGSDSGSSTTDNLTSDTTPTFDISCVTGSEVRLYVNGSDSGVSAVCSGASVSLTAPTLSEATHSITAIQLVSASDSVASGALSVTIDTTVPATPGVPDLRSTSDSGTNNTDNITGYTTPLFDLTCETGASVQLYVDGSPGGASGTCFSGSVALTAASLTGGSYSITAIQTDPAGNVSGESSALGVTILSPGVTVGSVSGSVDESGTTATFSIQLDARPTGDVVIDLSSADAGEATVTPSSLTFTSSSWNNPQVALITGVADGIPDADEIVTIQVSINTGSTVDALYDAIDPADATVTVANTDFLPLTIQSATTIDADGNGSIDHYRLEFNQSVTDASFPGYIADSPGTPTSDWIVTGYTNVHLVHGTAVSWTTDTPDDGILYIGFDEGPVSDTGAKPDITSTASPGIISLFGSQTLAQQGTSSITEDDGAEPKLVEARAIDGWNQLYITFSEPVYGGTGVPACGGGGELLPSSFNYQGNGSGVLGISGMVDDCGADGTVALNMDAYFVASIDETDGISLPTGVYDAGDNAAIPSNLYSILIGNPTPPLRTYQTQCWDAAGTEISCAGTGQDGEYQKGREAVFTGPVQHATYTGDYTTTDNATGLVWKTCSEGLSGADCSTGTATTFSNDGSTGDANDQCVSLNDQNSGAGYAGLTGWRLPSDKELLTVVKYNQNYPTIFPVEFPNTKSDVYWAGSTYPGASSEMSAVLFTSGKTYYLSKTDMHYTRCVAGPEGPGNHLIDNNDGTIIDATNTLLWQKCSIGQNNDSSCSGTATESTWTEAFGYCQNLNLNGYSWRLPTVNELKEISDRSTYNPAIDTVLFPNTESEYYWTSTTAAYGPTSKSTVYAVSFGLFKVEILNKSVTPPNAAWVRCVTDLIPMPPPAPLNLATTPDVGQIDLVWDASPGATSYNLYWSTSPGVTTTSGTKISLGDVTNYSHTGLTEGQTYYYIVTAENVNGESKDAGEVEVAALAAPTCELTDHQTFVPSARTTYDIPGVLFGSPSDDRVIVIFIFGGRDVGGQVTSATIGGVTADLYLNVNTASGTTQAAVAKVPTGATGDVSVTFSVLQGGMDIQVYRLGNLKSEIPVFTVKDTSNPLTQYIDYSKYSVVMGYAKTFNSADMSWTASQAFLEQVDFKYNGVNNLSSGYFIGNSSMTGAEITAVPNGGSIPHLNILVFE